MDIIVVEMCQINLNLVVDATTQASSRKRESIKSATANSVQPLSVIKQPGESLLVDNLDAIDINRSLQAGLEDAIETTTTVN